MYNDGNQYNGAPSSGRAAYYQHAKDKKQQEDQKMIFGGLGCCCLISLVALVYYLSGRSHIPDSYVEEGRVKCQTTNFLCDTICGNLPGHYKDEEYRVACIKGCSAWGKDACAQAVFTNDLSSCLQYMNVQTETVEQYCLDYPSLPDPSPHRACLIGSKGVATTEWPCKQGVSIIGKILAAHKRRL